MGGLALGQDTLVGSIGKSNTTLGSTNNENIKTKNRRPQPFPKFLYVSPHMIQSRLLRANHVDAHTHDGTVAFILGIALLSQLAAAFSSDGDDDAATDLADTVLPSWLLVMTTTVMLRHCQHHEQQKRCLSTIVIIKVL